MPHFITRRLNGLPTPPEWRATLFPKADDVDPRRLILTLDAYAVEGGVRLNFAGHHKAEKFLDGLSLTLDGASVDKAEALGTGRGVALHIPGDPGEVSLTHSGVMMTQTVAAADQSHLAGCNVIAALILSPNPQNVTEWAQFHVAEQGADAVFLMRRASPDQDIAAEDAVLRDALDIAGLKTVVIATTVQPLGDPTHPALISHAFAPNAPGKGSRTYEPDFWRSPLTELGLYDVMQHRFLRDARAVLMCDIADLIPRGDSEVSVFDAASASDTYLKFPGERLFPWRLEDQNAPLHGDHACYRFDGGIAENIWCVAPSGPLKDAIWRPFRVSTETPDPVSEDWTYYRCQAIRHPGEPAAALTPKSTLKDHTVFRDLTRHYFGADPKTAPAPLSAPAEPLKNDKILLVTTMKNEGPFILEWLAYHRAIGVTDFLVYTNDCNDGTDTFFDLLHAKGHLTHKQNPYREVGMKPQHAAYQDAQDTEQAKSADWVMPMDVDEYISIHVGDGTLHDLFAAVPDANMISMTWRLFGNADIAGFEERFTTDQFTACAPEYIRKPHQAWGFKTMFRPLEYYRKYGVHRPKGLRSEAMHLINWVNGSGQRFPDDMLRTGWRNTVNTWGYDLVTLNHYAVRSAESYMVKRDRGRVNHVDRDQGLAYWFRMNNNAEHDTAIQRMIPRQQAEVDKFMADPEIAAQHHACVAAHKAKIEELYQRPDYLQLYQDVTGPRLSALSKMHHHFGVATFLAGPGCIPEDFHERDDPGFFSPDEGEQG